jgi:hypothetical protein
LKLKENARVQQKRSVRSAATTCTQLRKLHETNFKEILKFMARRCKSFRQRKTLKKQKNITERYHIAGDSIRLPKTQMASNVRERQRREDRTRGEREMEESAAAIAAFKRLHCARLCSSRMDG